MSPTRDRDDLSAPRDRDDLSAPRDRDDLSAPRDWDDAYANAAHIPGADALPARWAATAGAYRAALGDRLQADLPYGPGPRARFDLVWPNGAPRGLAVFVHGGYWLRFDRSTWTHLAEGARARGWAVALPSYPLAPDATLPQITAAVAEAITAAAARVAGPIRLAGHSAGGHLVVRMLCADSPLAPELRERLTGTVSISGLHDLRPLMRTAMAGPLALDLATARAESPALAEPCEGAVLAVWVGADERPEFLRQARLMALVWEGFDIRVALHEAPGQNHFTVIDPLRDPSAPLTEAWVGAGG